MRSFERLHRRARTMSLAILLAAAGGTSSAGEGRNPFLVLFQPVEARFVRLTILGINEGSGAAVDELEAFAPGRTENLAAAKRGAKATASTALDDPRHAVSFLNDGRYGNGSCWIAASGGIEWAQIEFPEPHVIDTVAFSRDRIGEFDDRIAGSFRVEVSLDGTTWRQVAHFPGPGGGVRGRVTADRRNADFPQEDVKTAPVASFVALPRVRHELVDPAPQAIPPGETISLNGDWWMRQFPHSPRGRAWPPETGRAAELAKEVPREGLGEGSEWIKATVPGSVQSALLENGLAPHPWYRGDNFRALEKAVVGKETWFFKPFHVPESWAKGRVRLHFRGVDYRARYYLNGRPLGESRGHFAPVSFDVENLLMPEKENILAVQLDAFPYDSPVSSGPGRAEAAKCARSQILANWRGTDFAPTACPLGITDDVYLNRGKGVLIENVWVRAEPSADLRTARVEIDLTVDSDAVREYVVRIAIRPEDAVQANPVVVSRTVALSEGRNTVRFDAVLDGPRLWWPNGYGEQHLYVAEAAIHEAHAPDAAPCVLHRDAATFGIRKLEKAFNEGHEMSPYPWTFVVNGKKVYAKGAGWVPMNPLHLMDSARYERILRQAAAAHFTMIRWWGGGVPERPAFYEWCDRLGLMVYQDFFLANNEHDNEPFLNALEEQAAGFVRLRRNHPCIVQWTGGNELFNGHVNYQAQAILWKVVERHDPTRPFSPSSPAIGVKHAITDYFYRPETDFAAANRFGTDPELAMKIRGGTFPDWSIIGQPQNAVYDEWIARLRQLGFDPGNPAHHANAFDIQFTAEGGAATVANASALREILAPEEWKNFDPAKPTASWLYHNAKPGGYDWLQHATTERLFGPIDDADTYAIFAQFSRGQIIRYGLEEMRRRKFRFSGTLMWQLNETWPNAAGNAIVDYFGRPRVTYDAVRTAYAPLHASLRFDKILWSPGDPFSAGFFLTSDRLEETHARCAWRIIIADGKEVAADTIDVQLPANGSVQLGEVYWQIPEDYDSFFVVYCTVNDSESGTVLDETANVFSCHHSTSHFWRPLLEAPKTEVVSRVELIDDLRARVNVDNRGSANAILCRVEVNCPKKLAVITSANHFFLAPGARRTVDIQLEEHSSESGRHWKGLRVFALNGK